MSMVPLKLLAMAGQVHVIATRTTRAGYRAPDNAWHLAAIVTQQPYRELQAGLSNQIHFDG